MAGTIEKIKAKVDNVLHKDKDTTTTGTHHDTTHTGTTGTHTGTSGAHTSSGLPGSTHNDPTGPHSSHTANAADPRVDSDRYGAAGNTASAGGYGTTGTHGTTGSGLTGTHGTSHTHGSDPTGPHDSHLGNKADPRVDSDRYGAAGNTTGAGGYGTTGTHGTTGSGLTGSHGTTGHSTTGHSTTHGSDPTGPHDSKLANKLDPRVDSDRVGPAGNSTSVGGYGNEHLSSGQQTYQTDGKKLPEALLEDQSRADHHHPAGTGFVGAHSNHGTHGTTGSHGTSHTHGSDPTGPHDSHLANKADPRVDSDRYGAAGNTAGAGGYGSTGSGLTGSHNTHGTTGSGLTGSHGSDPTGPHDSRLGNKADPRVDSDRYGAAGNTTGAGGYGSTGSGLTGSHNTHGTTGSGLTGNQGYSDPSGPHDSHLGNKADPRVDSDRYGGAGNTHGTHQSGGLTGNNHPGSVGNSQASKTAGPHGSDVLNKLDPRVDSDLNGSKTIGGDRTYG